MCQKPEDAKSNGKSREESGHLVYSRGDVLLDRFVLSDTFGEGTFGKVIRATDKTKHMVVALKVIKNVTKYRDAAKLEIKVLKKLAEWDKDRNHWLIHMNDHFEYRGHACLMFDLLGPSIFDFLRCNDFVPFPIHQTIHIAWQLCNAVMFLHEHGITHTDLKPENILFFNGDHRTKIVGQKKRKMLINSHVRLIDFGSATFDHEHHSTVVSTRHYRAPEIILELGWEKSCDVWSIGCILYELYTGTTLFQTHDNLEHLAIMQRVIGDIPVRMARKTRISGFFKPTHRLNWNTLSKEATYVREKCTPLRHALTSNNPAHMCLFELMEDMLTFEPFGRIRLDEAVKHPLFKRLPAEKRESLV